MNLELYRPRPRLDPLDVLSDGNLGFATRDASSTYAGTFTRSSAAWMNGVQYANNTPRTVDYAGGKLTLIEGARTNLLVNSQLLDTSAKGYADWWGTYTADTGQTKTYTRTDIGNGGFAQRYTITGSSSTPYNTMVLSSPAIAVTSGATYTVSADIACNVSTSYISARWSDSSGATITDNDGVKLPISLGRVKRTLVVTAPSNAAKVSVMFRGIGATGEWMEIARPQFELGPFASSYIPTTTAAVTRASDMWRADAIASLIGSGKPFTIAIAAFTNGWATAPVASGQQVVLGVAMSDPSNTYSDRGTVLELRFGTGYGNSMSAGDGGFPTAKTNSIYMSNADNSGVWQRFYIVSDGILVSLYRNGIRVGSPAAWPAGAPTAAGIAGIGSQPNNNANQPTGASKQLWGYLGLGAPALPQPIPFIRPYALSPAAIAAEDARWRAALANAVLPAL